MLVITIPQVFQQWVSTDDVHVSRPIPLGFWFLCQSMDTYSVLDEANFSTSSDKKIHCAFPWTKKQKWKKWIIVNFLRVSWLFGFYGISTFAGYLMPNPFLYK